MNLNVLIPSRGRPHQLTAALYSLFLCASGEHRIQFCVACDDDDEETMVTLRALRQKMPLFIRVGPRPESLGSVANDLARQWPADAYVVFADDLLCISYGWDKVVADAVDGTPHGVFLWTAARPEDTYVPIITEKWRAAAGCIFTEHFPFWYDDLWLNELWVMATDAAPIYLDIKVVDKPLATIRMRDLRFWHDFYHAMRPERVRHGVEIAAKLGLPVPLIGEEFARRLTLASGISDEVLADYERRNHADTDAPSGMYLSTKAKAAELMRLKAA